MDVETIEVGELTQDPRNARLHPDENLAAIKASLAEFGQVEPLVVQRSSGRVIGGNGRLRAMLELGWREARVVRLDLDDARATALGLALNRTAELATWDTSTLTALVRELGEAGAPVASFGLGEDDLRDILAAATEPRRDVLTEDDVPEPPRKAITKLGDVWQLGRHRLVCGDSTDGATVSALMGDARAGLMNTDPPYGVGYANDDRPNPGVAKPRVAKPRVANDTLADAALQSFLESAFRAAKTHALGATAAWYLWHAHLTQGFFAAAAAAAAADVVLHRQIIWVKPVLLLGRGQYHWKHEPCFMGWVRGQQPPDYGLGAGERTQTTVWEIASVTREDRKEFNHATPKPVGLFAIPLVKHLRNGEIAYEPFAGSGPQFIAAEQLERTCYGIEIDPRYVDVVIERWQNLTGGKATRASGSTKRRAKG